MTGETLFRGLASLFWGAMLGLFYFGGLWLTLKATVGKPRTTGRLALSYVVRLTVALTGFWLVIRTDALLFFFALAGFFIVRTILTRVLGRQRGGRCHATHP